MVKVATASAFQIANRKPADSLTINAEASVMVAETLFPADHVRGINRAKMAIVFQLASRKPARSLTINAEALAMVAATLFPADHARGINHVRMGIVFQFARTNAHRATINVRDLQAESAESLAAVALHGELIRHAIQDATVAETVRANAARPSRLARKIAATTLRPWTCVPAVR
jgi:hypothetical protein